MRLDRRSRLEGLLLGTAVGDSIGLPTEGMSPNRITKLGWSSPLRHRLLFRHGLMSDDTEHTLMAAQAWLHCQGDVDRFCRSFAWRLRWWILALPAGVGLATVRSGVKLWLGFPPTRSGVNSAGNGGAMRSGLFGLIHANDESTRATTVRALTEITHRDTRATVGAQAIAEMVALIANNEEEFRNIVPTNEAMKALRALATRDREWQRTLDTLSDSLTNGLHLEDFWATIGEREGVSGYVFHTVPVALYAWLRYRGDFEEAITRVVTLGGDTDTVAAITGALCGATHGVESIPESWLGRFVDWPRSKPYIRRLASALAEESSKPVRCSVLGILPRNIVFLITVLAHGIMRYVPGALRCVR